jgi:hypothetical protein
LKPSNLEILNIHGFICIKKDSTTYLDTEQVGYFERSMYQATLVFSFLNNGLNR